MTHQMNLHPAPFALIKSGQKTIELRLNDEKRRRIRVGDRLLFINTVSGEALRCTVTALYCFNSFGELYRALPLRQCGYTEDDIAFAKRFIEWNTIKRGIQRVDACRTKDGRLLLVELEDLNPYLSLLEVDEPIRERFMQDFISAIDEAMSV